MGTQIEFVGKISKGKESERFKPYSETEYASGWVSRDLKFNSVCGDNRHMMQIKGGSFKDGHGDVYLFSKQTEDKDGNKIKGSSFKIPFKDRLTSPRLAEVAEFKKFVIDLEKPKRRYLLEKLLENIEEGVDISADKLKEVELTSKDEVEKALADSKKLRKEFVTEWDFAEFVNKLIESQKYKDTLFKIIGNYVPTYSENNQQFYSSYVPQKIYLAGEKEEPKSNASVVLYYDKDSLDSNSVAETGNYYINGYVFEYESKRKSNIPCPYTLVLKAPKEYSGDNQEEKDKYEKEKKHTDFYLNQFTVTDDSVKEFGVIVELIEGAQKQELTEDMLTDFQKEQIFFGDATLESLARDMGISTVYGDKIIENVFVKPSKMFTKNGRNDTVYTSDDLQIKPLIQEDAQDQELDDLFA